MKISKSKSKKNKPDMFLKTCIPLILFVLFSVEAAHSQKKFILEDETISDKLTYAENIYNSVFMKLGGISTGSHLLIEASDVAGAPATSASLQIKGYEGRAKGIHISDATYTNKWFIGEGYNYQGIGIGYSTVGQTEYRDNAKFIVLPNGNVGVGLFNPLHRFSVLGDAKIGGFTKTTRLYLEASDDSVSPGTSVAIDIKGYQGRGKGIFISDKDTPHKWFIGEGYNYAGIGIGYSNSVGTEYLENTKLLVVIDGNVAIGGLTIPEYKLAVLGKIKTTEVQVQPSPWPDYVFDPSYQLTPLSEVEKQIKKEGHLEGIPSQSEVEQNGIALGEMNAKLLEKIEELTLYLIEQDKEIKRMKAQIKKLENH